MEDFGRSTKRVGWDALAETLMEKVVAFLVVHSFGGIAEIAFSGGNWRELSDLDLGVW